MAMVTMNVSDEVLTSIRRSPREFVRELRLAAAIHWYTLGRISQEKAASLADMDRTDFLLALAQDNQDAFAVDFDDLKRELDRG